MKELIVIILGFTLFIGCNSVSKKDIELANKIKSNENFRVVKQKAKELISTGFSAGAGYGEVWIRDFNTFVELALEVNNKELVKEKLLMFFKFQGDDGNIVDGYIPKEKSAAGGYDYIYSDLAPGFAAHKNTVETDQESSLIQAVYKYVEKSGDKELLNQEIGGVTITKRMEKAFEYLLNDRYSEEYGLIIGGTTADWGDVQPETKWGVNIDDSTHWAIDIYDNAMLVIALKNFIELVPGSARKWKSVLTGFETNIRKYLWDADNNKFIPHVYLVGSPFPPDFNENEIFYTGGTAVAIEAGLLNKEEVKISLEKMIANKNAVGAVTIGLTLYPAYPDGFFQNPILTKAYTYQNGGDWTWFGGRMLQQLVNYGFVKEAYEQVLPFNERAIKNDGFYEWYTIKDEPKGSAAYRGSAGVLYQALVLMEEWAAKVEG